MSSKTRIAMLVLVLISLPVFGKGGFQPATSVKSFIVADNGVRKVRFEDNYNPDACPVTTGYVDASGVTDEMWVQLVILKQTGGAVSPVLDGCTSAGLPILKQLRVS